MLPSLPNVPLPNPTAKQVRVLADAAFKHLVSQAKLDWKSPATRPNVEQIGHDISHLVRDPEDFLESNKYITYIVRPLTKGKS